MLFASAAERHASSQLAPALRNAPAGYRAAAAFGGLTLPPGEITDIKTAADASSRAAVAASAAAAAVAVTKAAAARAAARIARSTAAAGSGAAAGGSGEQQQQQAGQGEPPAQLMAASASGGNGAAALAVQDSINGSGPPSTESSSSRSSSGGGSNGSAPQPSTPATVAASAAAAVAKAAARDAAPAAAATVVAAAAAAAGPPGPASVRGASTVEQLTTMAQTMQKLTAEVDGIVQSGTAANAAAGAPAGSAAAGIDAEVKVAAVEAVAAAEAAAITAVAAGDLAGANQVLQDAAQALQSTVAQLAVAETGAAGGTALQAQQAEDQQSEEAGAEGAAPSAALTPQQRAEQALAAAQAAAAQAADAAAVAAAASAAVQARQPSFDSEDEDGYLPRAAPAGAVGGSADLGASSSDEAVGLDAAPSAEAAELRAKGLPSYDSEDNILLLPQEQQPWWLPATQFLPGVPRTGGADAAAGAAAEADGGAGAPPPSGQPGPVTDVVIPPDLPLDEITAEVLKSWKLRDTHVETLVQKVSATWPRPLGPLDRMARNRCRPRSRAPLQPRPRGCASCRSRQLLLHEVPCACRTSCAAAVPSRLTRGASPLLRRPWRRGGGRRSGRGCSCWRRPRWPARYCWRQCCTGCSTCREPLAAHSPSFGPRPRPSLRSSRLRPRFPKAGRLRSSFPGDGGCALPPLWVPCFPWLRSPVLHWAGAVLRFSTATARNVASTCNAACCAPASCTAPANQPENPLRPTSPGL